MRVDTGQFQAMQDELAELTTRVVQLERDAFMLRTLEQMYFERSQWSPPERTPAEQARRRPAYLQPVSDDTAR